MTAVLHRPISLVGKKPAQSHPRDRRAGLRILFGASLLLQIDIGNALAFGTAKVERIEERVIQHYEWQGDKRVQRIYFDAEQKLQWDDKLVHRAATGACDDAVPPQPGPMGYPPRRVLQAKPRVDRRDCLSPPNSGHTVLGLDESDRVIWQRPLADEYGQLTGPQPYVKNIIGADEQGLVTNTLEVWSAATGETLEPNVVKGRHPDGWPIPRYNFYRAWFRSRQRDFIVIVQYDPDYILGKPGVHRLEPLAGRHELVMPERSCGTLLLGKLLVQDLRSDPGGRYLAMRRECQSRGFPSRHDFVVIDMQSKTEIYRERLDKEWRAVSMAMADNGDVGLALHNDRSSMLRLIRYRLPTR